MQRVKEIFKAIGKDEISQDDEQILSKGLIDSFDVMMIMSEIEKITQKPLEARFIKASNFESFKAILSVIKEIENEAL